MFIKKSLNFIKIIKKKSYYNIYFFLRNIIIYNETIF